MKKEFNIFIYLLVILPLVLTMQSCNSKKELVSVSSDKETSKIESIGGTWVLNTFDGKKSKEIFPSRTPIITIDTQTNEIIGNGGCNGISGAYTFKNGVFCAPNMRSTMMFCEDAPFESQLTKMLAEESVIKAVNGVLTFSQKGKVIARFTRGIDSQLLIGAWVLKTINGENISSILKNSNAPTIEFGTEENISGFAGCNRYSSTVEIDGTSVVFGPILTTRMACDDMAVETQFVKALSQAKTIDVSNDTLTLSNNGQILLVFTK